MRLLEKLGLLWLSVQAVSPIAAHASHGRHGLQHAHLHQAHQVVPRDISSFNLFSSTVLTNGTRSGARPALPPGKPQVVCPGDQPGPS
ncbi:uncharacterized protein BO80DRAFT_424119 [Aspergillus ibericus CBS 121593]|uniref:Uncharacterized protein n=1 Tax=Aspergillus ibericus CBS 121593 TaxID=1448316 RepID=A0A395H4S2_9EURO|nr:hypothetical protein BO80DRAFT_424119 [Aspergillus ibericus CBS 121593]RAL02205.1 hypothetical protein BO80DRAFT_424119 [Aspergillus ibericus CBS 121593]